MSTSQSFVARVESTAADAKISPSSATPTLGYVVQYHLIPADQGAGAPPSSFTDYGAARPVDARRADIGALGPSPGASSCLEGLCSRVSN